jgi:hypothetical protein
MNNGEFFNPNCEAPPGLRPLPAEGFTGDINFITGGGIVLGSSSTQMLLLKSVSGLYTIIKDKRNDTLLDRQEAQESIDVAIPDPFAKTGFLGG